MSFVLGPELERELEELVRGGGYHSPHEALHEALQLLKQHESARKSRMESLRAEIKLGLDQLDRGEGVNADAVFDEVLSGLPDEPK
jgi:antitoxin ParD1/3/4